MTGPQMEALRDALCSAFDQDALDQMLRLGLNRDREQLAGSGSLRSVVFKLIQVAVREGWQSDLVRAAVAANPGNPELGRFAQTNADLDSDEQPTCESSDGAGSRESNRRRECYRHLWDMLEDAHLRIRTENVDQPAFSALLRSVNTYIIKNSVYLVDKDHELAGRYLKLLMEFRAILVAAGNRALEQDWTDTSEIPAIALAQAGRGREVYDQIVSVRAELLGRVRHVLGVDPPTLPEAGPVESKGANSSAETIPVVGSETKQVQSKVHRTSFYVYVSDSKLAMLAAQVPRAALAAVAAELGIDASFLTEPSGKAVTPETKYVMAQMLERHLSRQGEVGTIDEPGPYFLGEIRMMWGEYAPRSAGPSPLVYFGGETATTIVGLGGSAHHVLGAVRPNSTSSMSATPYLVAQLCEELEIPIPKADKELMDRMGRPSDEWLIASAVHLATTHMIGTKEKVRFLARRLGFYRKEFHRVPHIEKNIILGTPLYVSLSDE